MSLRGAIALKPQLPSHPNNDQEWVKYFSDRIDACQSHEQVDDVYNHWADCINDGKYRSFGLTQHNAIFHVKD